MAQNARQTSADFKGDHLSIKMFGGLDTGVRVFDAAITANGHQIDSANAKFTPGVVNQWAYVAGAGPESAGFVSRIVKYINPTRILVRDAASVSVANGELRYGADNARALQAAITYISVTKKNGGRMLIPKGIYLTIATINVPSNVRIEGEGYTSVSVFGSGPVEPQSFVCCINPVPVFTISGAPAYGVTFAKLGMTGTPDAGSKGIYGAAAWDTTVEDCFFDCFGDHAVHIANTAPHFSVTGTFRHNFAQNCMLVRARSEFVGVFDIGCTDAFVSDNNVNASFADVSGIVTGSIAALAIRGTNSFVRHNQCGHSEVGVYVAPDCSLSVFVDVRADLNQGQGWVVHGSANAFIGCRSHANSLAADGIYDAFSISGAGNSFNCCRVTFNGAGAGPEFFRVNNAFATENSNTTESNYFLSNYIEQGSYLGADFAFEGTQKVHPLVDQTALFAGLPARPILRTRGDLVCDGQVDGSGSISWVRDGGAGANAKNWAQRINNPTDLNQLLYSIWNDILTAETVYLRVTRAGMVIVSIDLFGPVDIHGNLLVEGDLEVQGNAKIDSLTPGQLVATDGGDTLVSQPGLTTSQVVIESLNIFQDTIDYDPGLSSFTAIVAITNNTKTLDFTIGALTGDA